MQSSSAKILGKEEANSEEVEYLDDYYLKIILGIAKNIKNSPEIMQDEIEKKMHNMLKQMNRV
jgi:hypothetical protein